jgi:hypothetical protein
MTDGPRLAGRGLTLINVRCLYFFPETIKERFHVCVMFDIPRMTARNGGGAVGDVTDVAFDCERSCRPASP